MIIFYGELRDFPTVTKAPATPLFGILPESFFQWRRIRGSQSQTLYTCLNHFMFLIE